LGWGSFTHLTEREIQLGVLRAVRALAPRAPLAVSFFLRPAPTPVSRSAKMRRVLRKVLDQVGKRQPIEPGLGYDYGGGFVYNFTMEEVDELAHQAGYRVGFRDTQVFPHVILVPS